MIKPVFVPKAYIEEKGRRVEIEDIILINSKLITVYFNSDNESHRILDKRIYELKPFEVFIVFGDKEFSMLGRVNLEQTEGFSPDFSSFGPAFGPLEMHINLTPKESDLNGNNEP